MKKQTKLGLVLAAAALISVSVASLVSARGWVQDGADWRYVGSDGEFVTDTIQSSGNAKFYLNADGYMEKDYFLEDYDNANYYFGANGAMVTNTWVAIESDRVENTKDGYMPDNYWYYFQASGKAVKGSSNSPKKMTIDGKKYMFNENGQMCTGWVKSDGEVIDPDSDDDGGPFVDALYYAGGDNDGALRSGWVTYYDGYNNANSDDTWYSEKTTLYFYFNTTTNKKESDKEKKINGKTYLFDTTGLMLSGWDKVDMNSSFTTTNDDIVYYSGEDDGHKVKKGWVYAVPAQNVDTKAYDDGEEKYFYFNASGTAVKDSFKKINGKTYAFNNNGIMKTGIVIWAPKSSQKFVNTVDLDWADGAQIAKAGLVYTDNGEYVELDQKGGFVSANPAVPRLGVGEKIELHYFGDDGARKLNANTINFADDAYTFYTTVNGNKPSGDSQKKYYSLGIQCKASSDIKYGLFQYATPSRLTAQEGTIYADSLARSIGTTTKPYVGGSYKVLNTNGSLQNGSKTSKKDADDHYWLISSNKTLEGIFTVDVKRVESYNLGNMKATLSTIPGYDATSAFYVSITDVINHIGDFYDEKNINAIVKQIFGVDDITIISEYEPYIDEDGYFVFTPSTSDLEVFKVTYTGYQFKSDRGDKSVWMAFGARDNNSNTTSLNPAQGEYHVDLNNDYFLNCYWDSSFPKK